MKMKNVLNRSVSMKAFIVAIVIIAAIAFGGAYAATTVFLTPGKMEELRGIRYEITGKVEITTIDIVFNTGDGLWHVLMDGKILSEAASGTYTFDPTITAPVAVTVVKSTPTQVHTTGTETTITDMDLGTLSDYPTGNYLVLVKATKTA